MRFVTPGWRRAFGVFVIAHGLAHAVLPLRGWLYPNLLETDSMPLILYGVAVLGFAIAGIGLLGVHPFTVAVRPLLVLASAYSGIALFTFGASDLWWGIAVDAVLLLIGLTGVYRHLPQGSAHPGLPHRLAVAAAAGFVVYVASAFVLWPLHRGWGSETSEYALALPGDAADRNPAMQIQHAVTVNAPPEQVWPWLMQLGQDRGGFYSYDWLERAFGVEVRNVGQLRPEWQDRRVGELVRATQPKYLGGALGHDLGWTVKAVEPAHALVLQNWGAFVLQPTADGRTRFIIRTTVGHSSVSPWAAAIDMLAFELPHFIMERRMMLQIKSLAEQRES